MTPDSAKHPRVEQYLDAMHDVSAFMSLLEGRRHALELIVPWSLSHIVDPGMDFQKM